MFNEATDTIDLILDLNSISNRIDALHMLFSTVSSDAELNIDTIKTIAENLGTTENNIGRVTTNSICKFLPIVRVPKMDSLLCVLL